MHKNIRLLLFVTVYISFSLYSSVLAGADSGRPIQINVGVYQNPPKLYIDSAGKASGIFIEILEEIAGNEGWELTYVPGTWQQCLQKLQKGETDLLPDVALTFQRTEDIEFNKVSVLDSWSEVYVKKKTRITKPSDLKGKYVALLDESVQQESFSELMVGLGYEYTPVTARSFEDAFFLVNAGVADATIVNRYFGNLFSDQYGLENTGLIFSPASLYFAVKKGSDNSILHEVIDKYLKEWKASPRSFYYTTIEHYLLKSSLNDQSGKKLWQNILLLTAIVLLCTGIIILHFRQNRSRESRIEQIDQKLHSQEEKFQSYFDNAPFGIFVTDNKGNYIEANISASRITGYTTEELLMQTIGDLLTDESKVAGYAHFEKVTKLGNATGVFQFEKKSGETYFASLDAVRISDNRFIGFMNDVTEEHYIQNRVKRLSKIVEHSLNETYLFDATSMKFIEANAAAIENTGYSIEELLNLTPLDLKLDMKEAAFRNLMVPLINKEKQRIIFETRHYRKNGSFYHAEIYLQLMELDKERIFSAVVIDITERKNAEEELKKTKDNLEILVAEKTGELNRRVNELEHFQEVTIERELRMEQLRKEIELLKQQLSK